MQIGFDLCIIFKLLLHENKIIFWSVHFVYSIHENKSFCKYFCKRISVYVLRLASALRSFQLHSIFFFFKYILKAVFPYLTRLFIIEVNILSSYFNSLSLYLVPFSSILLLNSFKQKCKTKWYFEKVMCTVWSDFIKNTSI